MVKHVEAFWYPVGAQEVSITLLFPSPEVPPPTSLSYISNRKHLASRDKDHSTHLGRGLTFGCVLALPPPPSALELAQWCL